MRWTSKPTSAVTRFLQQSPTYSNKVTPPNTAAPNELMGASYTQTITAGVLKLKALQLKEADTQMSRHSNKKAELELGGFKRKVSHALGVSLLGCRFHGEVSIMVFRNIWRRHTVRRAEAGSQSQSKNVLMNRRQFT